MTEVLKDGDPEQYDSFVNLVIHEGLFGKLADVIEKAKSGPELMLLASGKALKEKGFFVHPTFYQTFNPHHKIMTREILGPLCAVYVYPNQEYSSLLETIDCTQARLDRLRFRSRSRCCQSC